MAQSQPAEQPLPAPTSLALAALAIPPLGAVTTQWLPQLRRTGPSVAVAAAGVGVTNALAEEVLWRGVPSAIFPGDPVLGWLWPAAGFVAWHLIPVKGLPAKRKWQVLAGAAMIGIGNGWIAYSTGSLRWPALSHAIVDSSGLRQTQDGWLIAPAQRASGPGCGS
jgi:membrane protease YdiL (CAAX protease family)